MNRKIGRALYIYLLLALCMSSMQPMRARAGRVNNGSLCSSNQSGSETEWQRVTPQGEEFSLLTPVMPALLKQGGNFYQYKGGEKVLEHRSYSAYAGDFIFGIESYKAAQPQKLLKDVEEEKSKRLAFEREVVVSGYTGKQYLVNSPKYYAETLSFATRQHVYLITLGSRDANNPSLAKFLSSLILGDKASVQPRGQVLDLKESDAFKNAFSKEPGAVQYKGQTFSPRDVTRKASIVWRPEPAYTEQARQDQVSGTVVLRAIFDANGQLNNIRVVSGLRAGLTEKAVEAALSIRFFPAEKDGERVSQYIQIEYNFNLY